jgi:hypothetical protein
VRIDLVHFLGPTGGLVAVAFMAGIATGWGLAVKFLLTLARGEIATLREELVREREDCHRRIADLTARVRELEDRWYTNQGRQLAQVRISTEHVLDRDRDGVTDK